MRSDDIGKFDNTRDFSIKQQQSTKLTKTRMKQSNYKMVPAVRYACGGEGGGVAKKIQKAGIQDFASLQREKR